MTERERECKKRGGKEEGEEGGTREGRRAGRPPASHQPLQRYT